MENLWLKDLYKTNKPIIAMCHLQALPGDPRYDESKGMRYVIDAARYDLTRLQDGGVDAIMFSNEFSMPYLLKVKAETTNAMARIIGELMDEIRIPYGVDVLWDPYASIDLAKAVDAQFVREIFSGVYASDFGLWNTNCGEVIRHQYAIGAKNVKLFFNIVPEAAQYLANRDIVQIARSTIFNHHPDGLLVSGLTAGQETDASLISVIKNYAKNTPVLANTGVRLENVENQLSIADGAIVATTFKVNGIFENAVDGERVKAFMDKVKSFRRNFD